MSEAYALRLAPVGSDCRPQLYSVTEAVMIALDRDGVVAYRCDKCPGCHVSTGRGGGNVNVPLLMAQGRFLAG